MCIFSHEIGKMRLLPMRGTFVGISAIFYGAKDAGIADKQVSKLEAIAAIDKRLNDVVDILMTSEEPTDDNAIEFRKNNEKAMYNLGMMRILFQILLRADAQILCQRNWKCGDS